MDSTTKETQFAQQDEHAVHSPGQSTQNPSESEPSSFKIYKPPRTTSTTPQSLPESWFTPTSSELKAAQTALATRVQALTNAPLQTRAMREASEKPKRERWPSTTIRIRFTDRTQLEKKFPSTDKIRSVYAFVRSCLREDVKPIKFILYQPPNRELKVSDPTVRDLSLYDLQLSPSSILLIKFLDETLNHINMTAPLSPSVLSHSEDLPAPPNYDANAESPSPGTSSHKPRTGGSSSGGAEKKVPKWLKLGKK